MPLPSLRETAPAPRTSPVPTPRPSIIRPAPVKKPGRANLWLGLAFLVIVAIAGVLFLRHLAQPPAKPVSSIRTARIARASVKKTTRLTGVTVAGKFQTLLTPTMRGSRTSHGHGDFQQILLDVVPGGTKVRKGDKIAEFERMYMLNRLDDYKALVRQTEFNLRGLEAALDVRRAGYEQLTRRYEGARAKAELDLKKAPVLSAIRAERNQLTYQQYSDQVAEIVAEKKYVLASERASIRRYELSNEIAKKELDRAQRNADAMIVKAPIDGMVVMQTLRRGSDDSQIRAGDQLYPGQPFLQIVDNSSMAVLANVNQVDVDLIRVGAPAKVQFDAFPGLELPARVVSVGALASGRGFRAAYVKEVPVRLQLEKLDPRVIPNFSVSADVVLATAEDVPAVPMESVFTEGGRSVAFVRGAAGWERREVELGVAGNVSAEVKSGLSEGDVVAAEWPVAPIEAGLSTPR
jgi:multidrug resistance efflux pump